MGDFGYWTCFADLVSLLFELLARDVGGSVSLGGFCVLCGLLSFGAEEALLRARSR